MNFIFLRGLNNNINLFKTLTFKNSLDGLKFIKVYSQTKNVALLKEGGQNIKKKTMCEKKINN